ncbi:MAG TPA: hypothetical protein VKY74_09430 [Chloroflexia bacterium]|nr:hypothetical protein [Chloroflexia bacterium]
MNTRLMMGIVAILLGLLVLIWPVFLSIVVGLALIGGGLWLTLQNAGPGPGV